MTTKKERAIRIIRNLKNRTTDRGVTEDEAIEASMKIASMMDQYDIDDNEIDHEEAEEITINEILCDKLWQELILKMTAGSIAELTGTVAITTQISSRKRKYQFVGYDADVAFASWLARAILDFVLSGLEEDESKRTFKTASARTAFRNGYLVGAGERITLRIREILDARNTKRAASNLPALRDKTLTIREAINETMGKLQRRKPTFSGHISLEAKRLGNDRGRRINLSQGIHGGERTQQALPKT